jgi:hypothetical protein
VTDKAFVSGDVTAVHLARRLGTDPKAFRLWLREQWRAGHPLLRGHVLHARWVFSEADAMELRQEYIQRS